MFIEDIELGMKVVPVSRTISSTNIRPANHSLIWRKAKCRGQPYLIVVRLPKGIEDRILCNIDKGLDGDYFQEWDLEPYIEKENSNG